MELTKEHFETVVETLASKDDIVSAILRADEFSANTHDHFILLDRQLDEMEGMIGTGFEDIQQAFDRHNRELEAIKRILKLA